MIRLRDRPKPSSREKRKGVEPLTPERHCHRRRRLCVVAVAVTIVRCELSLTEMAARCHDLCHKWQPSRTTTAMKTPTVRNRSLFCACRCVNRILGDTSRSNAHGAMYGDRMRLRLRVGGCGSEVVEEVKQLRSSRRCRRVSDG